jgi:hypothetical protein
LKGAYSLDSDEDWELSAESKQLTMSPLGEMQMTEELTEEDEEAGMRGGRTSLSAVLCAEDSVQVCDKELSMVEVIAELSIRKSDSRPEV